MAEPGLTRAGFAALTDAHGGDVARWPGPVRAAGRRFVAAEPETAAALLADAARLDALLSEWHVAGPGTALAQAVIAAAPRPRPALRLRRWWTGLGLAGAALAGSAGGVAAMAIAPPPPLAHAGQPAEATALFDDPQADAP